MNNQPNPPSIKQIDHAAFGRIAYEAHNNALSLAAAGKLPTWDGLPAPLKVVWCIAAQAVVDAYRTLSLLENEPSL